MTKDAEANYKTLILPSVGRLNFLYACRPGVLGYERANAMIAPGPEPNNRGTPVDINAFHAAYAHAHEGALRKTAPQMGVILKRKLHESARAAPWQTASGCQFFRRHTAEQGGL